MHSYDRGRQLGAKEPDAASRTVTTVIGLSIIIGIALCVGGIVFMDPLMRTFGASEASLPLANVARQYYSWQNWEQSMWTAPSFLLI